MQLVPMDPTLPVTGQWIKDLEQRVGGRLPDDYVAFLNHSNGGWIPQGWRPKSLEGPILQGFFSVMTGRVNRDGRDALSVHKTLSDGRLPPWMAPIAEDGTMVYCISIQKETYGKVFVVMTDDDQDDIPFEKREYALIANSFTDFYQQVIDNYTDTNARSNQ